MRVLFYTSSLTRSGAGLFFAVSGLAKALADKGTDITVIGGADEHLEADRAAWGRAILHPYPRANAKYGLQWDPLAALSRLRPSLVHVHGIWSATSIYGRAATGMGIPVVVSTHGMLAGNVLARRPLLKRLHGCLFERPLLRRAWVHSLNEPERRDIAQYLPEAAARSFVLPNGVQDEQSPSLRKDRSGALFLGRLHPVKQVVELIRAWRAGSPPEQRLKVAGWGDAEYEAQVRRAADGAANVDLVGPLHGMEKSAALAETRWFILPSQREGLPMAVLEAIQHGCIPIMTPECNLPELFASDIALPMAADFSDFAAVMACARSLPDAELHRRSTAAARYAQNYAWPKIAEAMMEHYQRCIAQKNPAPIAAR